jgi:predicted RND superfamily exporter protein
MVAASLLIFHRTWKIILITLIPVTFSLIISFGLMGLVLPVLTPQVVLVAPILIALGVAYGLYIANRYAEEEGIEDKEKRIRYALRTTGKAIFLSAMTTAFGFGAMLTVDMATMQVLGFGLSTGILASYLTTILMTPSLVIWLDYHKLSRSKEKKARTKSSGARRLGYIPMKHSRKILFLGIMFALISLSLSPPSTIPGTDFKIGGFSIVKANMDYITLSPADEPVVQKMSEQSDTFGSGQIGLMIVRGQDSLDADNDGRDDDVVKSMKDMEVLNKIDRLLMVINGNGLNDTGIDNAQAISIIDIMKMIEIPDFTDSEAYEQFIGQLRDLSESNPIQLPIFFLDEFEEWIADQVVGKSFWEVMKTVPSENTLINRYLKEPLPTFLMNIFYNSLGQEIRGMLVNDNYGKTIIYINMPNMDIVDTEVVVNQVDAAIDSNFTMTAKKTGEKPTASPLSGFGKVLVTVNDVIIDNANQSTIMALLMVFLLLFLVFRSWRIALITIFPVSLVVFWQYAAIWGIGALGEVIAPGDSMFSGDLNLFTALIGSIIIGIGVDFSIHITERVREKNFTLEGVMYAADTSGWSFIEATTTMVMGLTAVFLVNIPSIREFILLVIILLIFSAYSAIFILTSAYRLYLPRYNKLLSLKKIKG